VWNAARRESPARLTIFSGVPGRRGNSRPSPPLLYCDGNRRDEEDEQDETADADGIARGERGERFVERRLMRKATDEEEQERPNEPVDLIR